MYPRLPLTTAGIKLFGPKIKKNALTLKHFFELSLKLPSL